MKELFVNEIYFSIQGESSYAGLPCVFVRLTACNLRCTYCDTAYAFYEGTRISVSEVLSRVLAYNCSLIEITGGEPLLQKKALYPLISELLSAQKRVLIETSGSISVADLDPRVVKILDLKCPSSGECLKNFYENLEFLTPQDEVKFVIGTEEDYEWASTILEKYKIDEKCTVLFSTVFGEFGNFKKISSKDLVERILKDHLPVRFQLQMHKYIWPPDQRGV